MCYSWNATHSIDEKQPLIEEGNNNNVPNPTPSTRSPSTRSPIPTQTRISSRKEQVVGDEAKQTRTQPTTLDRTTQAEAEVEEDAVEEETEDEAEEEEEEAKDHRPKSRSTAAGIALPRHSAMPCPPFTNGRGN